MQKANESAEEFRARTGMTVEQAAKETGTTKEVLKQKAGESAEAFKTRTGQSLEEAKVKLDEA